MPIIAPSLLSADFLHLADEIKMLNESEAEWLHLDVMDGRFVPNISYGFPVIKAVKAISTQVLDVHLMILEPEKYIADFAKAGADHISVHIETCPHLHRTIQMIHAENVKAGVAINPHTPISSLVDIIEDIDLVLIMSVNPGFGGQKFIQQSLKKIAEVKELILQTNSKALIEVDGGVNLENAKDIIRAGADALVAGNAVFAAENPSEIIKRLHNIG